MADPTAAIFVGSTMGDTWDAAEQISNRLGSALGIEVPCLDVETVEIRLLERHDPVIVGCSTWDIGQLQTSWERRFAELDSIELSGRRVALFGSGDQLTYDDTFQDAMGILADKFEERGARLIGSWPLDGYVHSASLAQRGDRFVGLALDYDNQPDRTAERIEGWVGKLVAELGCANTGPGARNLPLGAD